jgi:hypothetical protein
MVLMCGMAIILPVGTGQRQFASNPCDRHLARHRPVAGVLLDELLSARDSSKNASKIVHDASHRWFAHELRMTPVEKRKKPFSRNRAQERAQHARAKLKNSTPNVVLFDQRLVARLVLPLEVIEQRTARGDHFQQPAT